MRAPPGAARFAVRDPPVAVPLRERLRVDALEAMTSSLVPTVHMSHTGNTLKVTVVLIS